MKKSFICCTAGDRKDWMIRMIDSISYYLQDDWNIYINFQKYQKEDLEEVVNRIKQYCQNDFQYITSNDLDGCHLARVPILTLFQSDVWLVIDDDMMAIPDKTKWNDAAEYIYKHKDIALLSCMYYNKNGEINEPVDNLNMFVCTAGGLLLRDEIAKFVSKIIPPKRYILDNPVWSFYTYMAGYNNILYPDSFCIHEDHSTGGRQTFYELHPINTLSYVPKKYLGKDTTPMIIDFHNNQRKLLLEAINNNQDIMEYYKSIEF